MTFALLNKELVIERDAKISIFDRSTLFSEGVYEVFIGSKKGGILEYDAHFKRLNKSLKALQIHNPFSKDELLESLYHLQSKNDFSLSTFYLQINQHSSFKRTHCAPNVGSIGEFQNHFILQTPYTIDQEYRHKSAQIQFDWRWQLCELKTTSLLGNTLARTLSHQDGFDEVILLKPPLMNDVDDVDNVNTIKNIHSFDFEALKNCQLTEASASTVVLLKNGALFTPKPKPQLLGSITLEVLEQWCKDQSIAFNRQELTLNDLSLADEVWLISTTKPIWVLNHIAIAKQHKNLIKSATSLHNNSTKNGLADNFHQFIFEQLNVSVCAEQ